MDEIPLKRLHNTSGQTTGKSRDLLEFRVKRIIKYKKKKMPIYDHVKVFFDAVRLHHAVKHRGAALEILNMLFIRFYALAVEYCGTDYIILTSHFCLDLEMDEESKLFFIKIYTTVVCTCTYIC